MPDGGDARIRVVGPSARSVQPAGQTAGMTREEAFSADGRWVGLVRVHPSADSGWHHHGDNDTYVYVVSGALRFEFAAGGAESAEAARGDFVHIPARLVHRETNALSEEGEVIVVRAGDGPPLYNVEGPDG